MTTPKVKVVPMEKRSMIIPASKGPASMPRLLPMVRRPIMDPMAFVLRQSIPPRAMIARSDMPPARPRNPLAVTSPLKELTAFIHKNDMIAKTSPFDKLQALIPGFFGP
jgi:hypothetical protein